VSTFLTVIHVFVCFMMVALILLQRGKGADIGAAFAGGSHTLFGARGATSFLAKVTIGCATIFMVTSISLAVIAKQNAASSVIDDIGETGNFFGDTVAPAQLPELPAKQEAAPAEGTQP